MPRKDYKKHDYQINMHGSLVEARNDENHVNERRYADKLKMTASGTLLLGAWTLLKGFMVAFRENEDKLKIEGIPYAASIIVVAVIFALAFAAGILFRYIVWKGATKEAASGRKRNGYLVSAVLLIVADMSSMIFYLYRVINNTAEGSEFTGFIFDIASCIILCELLQSVYALRKARGEIEASGLAGDIAPDADAEEVR